MKRNEIVNDIAIVAIEVSIGGKKMRLSPEAAAKLRDALWPFSPPAQSFGLPTKIVPNEPYPQEPEE